VNGSIDKKINTSVKKGLNVYKPQLTKLNGLVDDLRVCIYTYVHVHIYA
jgi:hypothetical protein